MTPRWRIVVGSDNAGVNYKNALKTILNVIHGSHQWTTSGVATPSDDTAYPHIAVAAARKIAAGEADRALLFCGTGLGVAIAANKVPGVRAVTAHDSYSVERSVLSNNAQVLAMGERVIGLELAKKLVDQWLDYRVRPQHALGGEGGSCRLVREADRPRKRESHLSARVRSDRSGHQRTCSGLSFSSGCVTTVDEDIGPIDHAGRVTGQEQGRRGDFIWVREAARGDHPLEGLSFFPRPHVASEVGEDNCGRNGVDRYSRPPHSTARARVDRAGPPSKRSTPHAPRAQRWPLETQY